jgi:hypothetical protein
VHRVLVGGFDVALHRGKRDRSLYGLYRSAQPVGSGADKDPSRAPGPDDELLSRRPHFDDADQVESLGDFAALPFRVRWRQDKEPRPGEG